MNKLESMNLQRIRNDLFQAKEKVCQKGYNLFIPTQVTDED